MWSFVLIGAGALIAGILGIVLPAGERLAAFLTLVIGAGVGVAALAIGGHSAGNASTDQERALLVASALGFVAVLVSAGLVLRRARPRPAPPPPD